ncbi:hypothetical protein MNBD_DELTA01-1246 [hydrothermal vent metagenome]|uniref:Gfo/Idh/MocA family oxidoreductase n=1 Tax=hydrothermal vent metagenome TaxID=652676 RepID=A0A3B0R2Y8_9ZZZZ
MVRPVAKGAKRVLVVGTGSIGVRHIENLLALGAEVSAVSMRSGRAAEVAKKYSIEAHENLSEALGAAIDAVVIANRTDEHVATALLAAERGLDIFVEKPFSNLLEGVDEIARLVREKGIKVETGYMMRFHPNLIQIKRLLTEGSIGKAYFARAYVGQYLPDWRAGTDYRSSYSAKQAYGGGVVFDLSHELDYLSMLFGDVSDVYATTSKVSELDIETEDLAQILLDFADGVSAHVEMDYLSPIYRRGLEIVGSKGVISWDYPTGRVILRKKNGTDEVFECPEGFTRNSMFLAQMENFLSVLDGKGEVAVSLDASIEVLKVTLAVHASAASRSAISPCDIMVEGI